jgi:hypothetical protein
MTSTETSTKAPSKRSPGVVAAIIIVVVIVLAGGAFVVYKLTKSKDEPTPALKVAKTVTAAVASGNTVVLRSNSTGQGTSQLIAMKPADASGFTLVARDCKPFAAKTATRVCTVTRPGGQLQLRLIFTGGAWKVDLANIGAAGLPPSSTSTTT